MSSAMRVILPVAGAAVGFVGSGFNPAGAMAGYQLGSMAGSAFGGSEGQSSGMMAPVYGSTGTQQQAQSGMVQNPGTGMTLSGVPGVTPEFATSNLTEPSGSKAPTNAEKAQALQGQLMQMSAMQDKQDQQEMAEAIRKKAEADAEASRYRPAPNPSFVGASPGNLNVIPGGFRLGR